MVWYIWFVLVTVQIDMQTNGSPLNNSPSTTGGNLGPSYASTVKAGTSDDDQWNVCKQII